jgi:Bacterial PH domain
MIFEKIELESDEKVLRVARKHWFIIMTELLGVLVMLLIPFFLLIILTLIPGLAPESLHLETHLPIISYFISLWLLMSLMSGFMIWTHYYLDLWIITDRRIIAIDQVHFFNRKVSSFRLERLQDVKVQISGIIPTFLNFGTLHAHTASNNEENFTTTGLPDPRDLQATIQKATDERLLTIGGQTSHLVS